MPLIFWEGRLLFRHGRLAMDLSCCCGRGGNCCNRKNPVGPTPEHLPEVLHATIIDIGGFMVDPCSVCDGKEFDLTWSAAELAWVYEPTGSDPCDLISVSRWRLTCFGPDDGFEETTCGWYFLLSQEGSTCAFTFAFNELACSCNPVSLDFDFEAFSGVGCCADECADPFNCSHSIRVHVEE